MKICCVDFNHRNIGLWIGTDQLGWVFDAVHRFDGNGIRVFDNMVVGHDIAIFAQDDAASGSLRDILAENGVAIGIGLRGNFNDGRPELFNDTGNIEHLNLIRVLVLIDLTDDRGIFLSACAFLSGLRAGFGAIVADCTGHSDGRQAHDGTDAENGCLGRAFGTWGNRRLYVAHEKTPF